jgi:uroporphyrinogen decarboxylase
MLEGGGSKNYANAKTWVYRHPQLLHSLLSKLSIAVADYLVAQIKAGVDTIMIFDSWGGVLSDHAFNEFSLNYITQVLYRIATLLPENSIPSIVFTKGGGIWLKELDQLACTALGIDWSCSLANARANTTKVLQGNLDPVLLSVGDKASITSEVKRIITAYQNANHGSLAGHIFNLGHGILPSALPDNVAILVDTVHELTRR